MSYDLKHCIYDPFLLLALGRFDDPKKCDFQKKPFRIALYAKLYRDGRSDERFVYGPVYTSPITNIGKRTKLMCTITCCFNLALVSQLSENKAAACMHFTAGLLIFNLLKQLKELFVQR